jgi:hypothetical protein
MPTRTLPLLLILVGAASAAEVPDPAKVRGQIDDLVQARLASGQPANLGLIGETLDLAIGYGAAVFDSGDPSACADFYAATAAKLVKSFSGIKGTSTEAATALQELADAGQRQQASPDPIHRAWSLRYAIDQIKLTSSIDEAVGKAEIQEGAKYFGLATYEEALLSWSRADGLARELAGSKPGSVPPDLRIAGILDAQALLMLKRIPEAAAAMSQGVLIFPEMKGAKVDWHQLSPRDHTTADHALADAQAAAKAKPDDADLAFLVAVEQICGGEPEDGQRSLAAVLKLSPKHAGALLLSGADASAKPPPAGAAGGSAVVP